VVIAAKGLEGCNVSGIDHGGCNATSERRRMPRSNGPKWGEARFTAAGFEIVMASKFGNGYPITGPALP
jgi:hypothetical protein